MPALSACHVHVHRIGLGPAQNVVVSEKRQFYMFFGLFELHDMDTGEVTADITSYEIRTEKSFTDWLLMPFLLPLTVTSRTVTVTR